MVNFIEETFEVYIDNVAIAVIDVLLCFMYRLLGAAIGPESIALIIKINLKFYRYYLSYRLL
jgi:hypothetical protein